ncbi:cysteine desulfurase [Treponema sp. OMZ 840]|uniref:aminotransferase class V-fold PLP-dependent enzyme n=1 Tax=Treponema sp. OMZ 840 TaxID=244313 RepID=UPI003D91394F
MTFNVSNIRKDFPLIDSHCLKLIYLDNAATTQKPLVVIDALTEYYKNKNANIHRGAYELSIHSTDLYENSRKVIRKFIGAHKDCEIIFTKNTTESINIVAYSFCETFLKMGGNIITTELEHHSNYLPWLAACSRKSGELRLLPIADDGFFSMTLLERLIDNKTALVAVTGASNAIGLLPPLKDIIKIAHAHNVPVLVDGAQLIAHSFVDVSAIDCDFFTFSAHKIYGPTGIGVLYGKEAYLEKMHPYNYGGDMVDRIGETFGTTTWQNLPTKFEAGTQDVGAAVGLSTALRYINVQGTTCLHAYEQTLTQYTLKRLDSIKGITVIAKHSPRVPLISFISSIFSPYDISMLLAAHGIASRCGELCAQPLMKKLGLKNGLIRISIAFYNTKEEIDRFCDVLEQIQTSYL